MWTLIMILMTYCGLYLNNWIVYQQTNSLTTEVPSSRSSHQYYFNLYLHKLRFGICIDKLYGQIMWADLIMAHKILIHASAVKDTMDK